jgi:chemosensory pili system protein ChpA (sensor histidine kinase/response regulator)
MTEKVVGGLKWVKGEIAATLRRVRDLVEAHGPSGEPARMKEAADALLEVRGVLMALQLTLPARLAEEMQRLAQALGEGRVVNLEGAAEALMLALIQLPNHLDRLEAGADLPPLTLWPTINDLRESRGAQPLTQAELLVPGSVLAEDADSELTSEALEALGGVIRKVRPHFHRHLLDWYRPATSVDGLQNLRRLFHQLHRYFEDGVLADLFRLAEAYAEALEEGQVSGGSGAQPLIGRVDRVFKPLTRTPPEWPEIQAHELVDELLNALAHGEVRTPIVVELQGRYGQTAALGDLPEGVSEALAGLANTVLRELGTVKERLDLFVRSERSDRTPLDEIRVSLRDLARTLDVANTGRLPARLRDLADAFGDLAMSDAGEDAVRLEPLAAELLGIEAVLQAYADHRRPPEGTGAGSGLFAAELRSATLQESHGELARVKEAILACYDYGRRPEAFGRVPDQLANVSGALQVLGDDAAGHLAEDIAALIRRRYVRAEQWPREEELVLLADAIAALELHIERMADGWSPGDDLIARGGESLAALDALPVDGPRLAPASDASTETAGALGAKPQVAQGDGISADQGTGIAEEFLEIFLEEAREETASAAEQLSRWRAEPGDQEALATLRRSFHTLKGSGRLVGAERVGQLAQATEGLLNRVIEGSLEAGSDLMAMVADAVQLLPELVTAEAEGRPVSVAHLVERAGRLVAGVGGEAPDQHRLAIPEVQAGAKVIPWPSGTRTPDAQVQPAEEGEAAPAERGTAPLPVEGSDMTAGTAVAEATGFEAGSPVSGPASVPEDGPCDDGIELADHESQFVADEELLGIFQAETAEHLDALRHFLQQAAKGERVPDETAVRALHTLAGSARMAGIDSIADVAKPLELRLRAHREDASPIAGGLLDLLSRAMEGISVRIAELPGPGEGAAELLALARLLAQPDAMAPPVGPAVSGPAEECVPQQPLHGVESRSELLPTGEQTTLPSDSVQYPEPPSVDGAQPRPEPELPPESAPKLEPEPSLEAEISLPVPLLAEADATPIQPPASAPGPDEEREIAPRGEPAGQETRPLPLAAGSQGELGDEFEAQPADSDLKNLFLEDARDLLDGIDTQIREWQFAPQELGILDGLKRSLHTLKGSARLTGITAIGDLSHALETRLTVVGGANAGVDDSTLELAQKAADALSIQVDALERGAPIPRARTLVEALSRPPEAAGASVAMPDLAILRPAAEAKPVVEAAVPSPQGVPVGGREQGAAAASSQIRVRGDLLNRLVDDAGEIGLYRARLSQRNGLMGFGLAELDQTVTRLREQLRLLEIETEAQILHRFERDGLTTEDGSLFDPLELDRFSTLQQLSRALAETVNDLVSLRELLGGYQRESADLLTQQARLAEDLQDGLLRTRMVPFVQVVPRLHRLVRQTADSLGKSARLEVIGPEVELDRSILDRLVAPLEHLLRNAVDHGLEGPEGRAGADKPPVGVITLALGREGNDVVINLSDDGRGMDVAAIRRQAIARGLLAPQVELADEALMQFVFEPGFSTQGRVTQISGRGVGMDVVNSEVKAANGTIAIDSVAGRGTSFTIRLPLTLAIIEAFLVNVGDNIYAVPHSTIEGAARIGRDELAAIYRGKGGDFRYRDHDYRVAYLGAVLDPRQAPQLGERRWVPLLLTRVGDLRVAFQVDSLIESNRILVKPLGPQLTGVRWLSGGTILPDGRVALILDALALLRSGAIQDYLPTVSQHAPADAPVCVMVVDDSLTVRRVTARLLRRQNMEVLTAKDGVEALTLLDERRPDVMLLDIEMPRMDGYELTRHVRRSDRLKDLPIIMITSRTGDKHRDHALSLGVDRFLGKPYQESELLDEISSVLTERRG